MEKRALVCYWFLLFSHQVLSDSLWPHGLQHTRLPCLSPTPGACSNSCPLSRWCHPTISFSVAPFSSCLQSFPASGVSSNESVLCIRWPRIGASASASVLPMNYQGWFPLGLTGLITCYPRDSQESSPLPQFKSISILRHSASFTIQHSHPYMTTGKIIALIIWIFFSKVVWLLF